MYVLDGEKRDMKFLVAPIEDEESCFWESKPVMREGQFSNGSHRRVKIEFPNWRAAVVQEKIAAGPSPVFLACFYYQPLSPTSCLIHFIIVPNQEDFVEVNL